MHRHPALVSTLTAAALATACAGGPSGELVRTMEPSAAPFLGDSSTTYARGDSTRAPTAGRAASADGSVGMPADATTDATADGVPTPAPAAGAAAPSSLNAMREIVRRARVEGGQGCLLVMRRGADTLSVEHVARDGELMRASLSLPTDLTVAYTIREYADGTAESLEASITQYGTDVPYERFWVNVTGDSIMSRTASRNRPTINGAYAVPGRLMTYIESSAAMLEQMVRHARRSGEPVTNMSVLVLGDPSVVIGGAVIFQGADSAIVTFGDILTRLAVDADGRVLGGVIDDANVTIDRVELAALRQSVAQRP